MHARSDGHPRTARVRVAGGPEQRFGGLDALRRMPLSAQEVEERGHELVADELVDRAVMVEHDLGRRRVEPVEEAVELCRRHPFRQGRGATDVGKQHGEFDLGAAMVLGDERETRVAHGRIRVRRSLPDQPHHRRGDTRERSRAQATARLVREVQEDPPRTTLDVVAPGQKVSPECLVGIGWLGRGHATSLLVADRCGHSAHKRKPPVLPKGPGAASADRQSTGAK